MANKPNKFFNPYKWDLTNEDYLAIEAITRLYKESSQSRNQILEFSMNYSKMLFAFQKIGVYQMTKNMLEYAVRLEIRKRIRKDTLQSSELRKLKKKLREESLI
jgi:hypothetical protein